MQLAEKWERIAGRKFSDADHESDEMGKRLIEHGATCYFNCAQELRRTLQAGDASSDFRLEVFEKD
jgi:hypothetical protein